MIVMSALCHDDSGFDVIPIGQLTCMTAICSTASTNTLVGCRLRARTSGRHLGTERVMCLALPVNVNHVLILFQSCIQPSLRAFRWLSCLLQVGMARRGQELGGKIVIVIALAVVAVVSAEFPGIIRAARLVAAL